MRIANNIMAMNTHRQYTINNNNISKSAEKLSSGYRVNRAGDDAAGLAISEKMRSQIRGLNMASKNSQDGNSLIQTAEGALQEVHSILQRMNELSVQSATGTNQTLDRNALNAEFQQLKAEVDDIAEQTTFNDMNLLDGTFTTNLGFDPLTGYTATNNETAKLLATANPTVAGTSKGTYSAGVLTIEHTDAAAKVTKSTVNLQDVVLGAKAADGVKAGEDFVIDLTTYGLGSYTIQAGATPTTHDLTEDQIGAIAANLAGGGAGKAIALAANKTDQSLKIQVGAKEGEQMTVGINEVSSNVLGLTAQSIATQKDAGRAISVTRSAINQVSTVRAALGAAQNRLDHKINNLGVSTENLQAAESRIRDVDMASEMTQFTKSNILSQAATAMLAQANSLPQNVLQLLR